MRPPLAPEIRFKQEHFHHLVSNDKRSTCKVHLQRVDTFQSCAVCGVRMRLEPCFLTYHTLKDHCLIMKIVKAPSVCERRKGKASHQRKRKSPSKLNM